MTQFFKKIYNATINKAPTTEVFLINGTLSPMEFQKAGDKLIQDSAGWSWKSSTNPGKKNPYLPDNKQFLMLDKVKCTKRATYLQQHAKQTIQASEDNEIIVIQSIPQEETTVQDYQKNFRFYTMYIVYDEYYFTPRMYFSATTKDGIPLTYQQIKEDVMSEYKDKTLTQQVFPYFQNRRLPTVHPCKHSQVLKTMTDSMIEGGTKVNYTIALFIFLKFITSVIPTVEFDSGDLWIQ